MFFIEQGLTIHGVLITCVSELRKSVFQMMSLPMSSGSLLVEGLLIF